MIVCQNRIRFLHFQLVVRCISQTKTPCPLFAPQLYHDIGLCGEGSAVPNILNGTYVPPPNTSETMSTFLQSMWKSSNIPDMEIEDCLKSTEDFFQSWKRECESTTSIGPHISHNKAPMICPTLATFFHMNPEIPFSGGLHLPNTNRD